MEDESEEASWGCVLPFLTDSVEFAHGVEVGALWEQLKCTDHIEGPYHRANQDQILLMLSRLKWTVCQLNALNDDWFHIEATAPVKE